MVSKPFGKSRFIDQIIDNVERNWQKIDNLIAACALLFYISISYSIETTFELVEHCSSTASLFYYTNLMRALLVIYAYCCREICNPVIEPFPFTEIELTAFIVYAVNGLFICVVHRYRQTLCRAKSLEESESQLMAFVTPQKQDLINGFIEVSSNIEMSTNAFIS